MNQPFPNAAPDRYVVCGHPVEHSQSPFIHQAFAAATGQAIDYGRLPCPPDGFADTVRAFERNDAGLPGRARGCNVTVPFKFEVLPLTIDATPRARLAAAANTIRFDADGWRCDNTDGIGLVSDLEGDAATPLAGRRLLLIGAGGASAGVLGPLMEAGVAELRIVNRTPARAVELVQRHAGLAERLGIRLSAGGLDDAGRGWDVVVNASASSLAGQASPVAPAVLRPGTLAVDLMYGAKAEPFMRWAADHGAVARDGLGMLVEQAAEAFHFFRGVRPATAPVLAALRARLAAAAR